jgi:hypothetical protein
MRDRQPLVELRKAMETQTMETQHFDWLGLEDKVCAVTGAGGGIGRAVAVALALA